MGLSLNSDSGRRFRLGRESIRFFSEVLRSLELKQAAFIHCAECLDIKLDTL